jgi:integrase
MLNNKRKRKSTGKKWNDENIEFVKKFIIPELEKALKSGVSKSKSFKYYSEIYLDNQAHRAARSYLNKLNHWKRALKVFENKNVDEITASEIQTYVNSLQMKARSKQPYIHAIKETLHLALMDGVIQYNPGNDVRAGKDPKVEIDYFTKDEMDKIMKSIQNDKDDAIYNYVLIVASTGLRPEEALALMWNDFRDNCIYVSKARTINGTKETKSVNGIRRVPFVHFNLLRKNRSMDLFPKQKGSMHLRHQWIRVLERAEVRYRAIKNLRHTYATLSLQQNVPINVLSSVMGHSSPKVTLSHYSSVIKEEQALFDDRLFSVSIDVSTSVSNEKKALKIG